MKKVMKVVAVFTLLVLGTSVMANEPKLTAVESSKNIVFNWEGSMVNTTLSFVDSEDNVIYSDFLEASVDYSKKFNLKTLAEGDYYLKLENSLKVITYSVKVTKDAAFVFKTEKDFKPVFKNEDGMIYVNYLNEEMAPVEVAIYDAFGRKLFNETMKNEISVAKAFNFKDAHSGEYSIVVKSDTNTFSEVVSVQ